MVDCRLCREHDRVFVRDREVPLIVCCKFEMIVKWDEAINGDCEYYVDVDRDDTPLREYKA